MPDERNTAIPAAPRVAEPAASPELVIRRTFDAPRDLVWRMWTEPEHAARWWGPDGFTAPELHLATRPGEPWRAVMRSPEGRDYRQHGVLREIVPPERLAYTFIWDDEPGVEMLVEVTFAERGGKTEMHFHQSGFPSVGSRDGHEGGWREAFDRLANTLNA